MSKRLYRSEKEKIIGGVCVGLGEYFSIDPVIIRLVFVLLLLAKGAGFLAYIIAWIIIPKRGEGDDEVVEESVAEADLAAQPSKDSSDNNWTRYIPGVILIAVGLFFILREQIYFNFYAWDWLWDYGLDFDYVIPAVLILFGVVLLFRSLRRSPKNDNQIEGGEHS